MLGRRTIVAVTLASLVTSGLVAAASSAASSTPPVVTGLDASSGSTAGQAHVIVDGRGFSHVQAVYFGGMRVPTFRVISSRELVAYAPPERHGVIHVTVRTSHGTSTRSRASRYRYVHASLPAAWTATEEPSAVVGKDPVGDQGIGATACPSTRCYFVGDQDTSRSGSTPIIGTVDGGAMTEMSAPAPPDQPYSSYAYLSQLTCASATFCVAEGENGGAGDNAILATLSHGSWTVVTAPSPPDTAAPVFGETVTDVSCGAPGSCVALGYLNYQDGSTASTVLTLHRGTWTAAFGPYPNTKAGGTYVVNQVSCATASWCLMAGGIHLVVDQAGHFSSEVIPEPPGAKWAKAGRGVMNVSCHAVGNCTMLIMSVRSPKAGYEREDFVTDQDGDLTYHRISVPADSHGVDGLSQPDQTSLSCPSVNTCFTYDLYVGAGLGNSYVSYVVARLHHGVVREYVLPQADGSLRSAFTADAIYCASATVCVVVGTRNRHSAYETFADGVWTPRVIPGFGQNDRSFVRTNTVSCAPSGSCLAAGGYTYTVQKAKRTRVFGSAFLAMGADR